jgi:protein gp37
MAENSAIEWTDTTWNPVMGCTKISAGCDNCYAARFSERLRVSLAVCLFRAVGS